MNVGALYREIRRVEADGLVEPLRTEQVGRRPPRTVYRITDAGLKELGVLRASAIRELRFGPDAFGVALLFGRTWGRAELAGLLQERRRALAEDKAGVEAEGAHLLASGAIGPLDAALFRRRAMQLDAELRWHDEFDRILDALPGPPPRAVSGPETSEPPTRARRNPKGGKAK